MRLRRRLPVLFGFLLFIAAVAAVVELRKHAPPEPARLLPGADGFAYVNLQWVRRADIGGHAPVVPHDPEYDQFIQATGFDFERDLAQAAFAVHYASPATGGQTRFSEVLVAHIDGDKLRAYLRKLASSVESHQQVDIYSLPIENHTLRVAILGVEVCTPHLCTMVAASNHDNAAVIRGIIDRSRKLASPFGGPALLRQFYRAVPQLPLPSLGWAIFKVNPAASELGPSLALTGPATIVASVQYLAGAHFRAEAFTTDEESAQRLCLQANAFLNIFQSAEASVSPQRHDADFDRVMKSIKIQQENERAILTATIPAELIRRLVAQGPPEFSTQNK
jgi:hypothetical protein